jgi:DnaJ-class molecular chaperone
VAFCRQASSRHSCAHRRGRMMDNNLIRCEPCLGMGYKGRYRQTAKGKAWKIEACRACGGRGERPAPQRKRKASGK